MKKLFTLLLAAVFVSAAAFAGGSKEESAVVSTDGSTSMEKVILSLAEVFEEEEGIAVTYNPTGSSSGITAAMEGRADIGLSSRALKQAEKDAGLTETILALDGIAMIVNNENPVSDLTLEQIAAIYKGEITNWSEVGGSDGTIVLIGREAGSGTRDGFESISATAENCKYNQELTSTGAVITAVASNPNAIGYASLASVEDNVKALMVNGIPASEETVKSGEYVVQRPFVLATKTGVQLSEAAQKFFDYITSSDASQVILEAGAVPLH